MGPSDLLAYLGGALGYAAAASLVLLGAGRLVGWRAGQSGAALVFATAVMVFLGLSPFPPADAVVCKPPILAPFHFLEAYPRYWREGRTPAEWLGSTAIMSPVMNFAVCAVIGVCLALRTPRWPVALGFGVALGGFIEFSQLSGLWGFYPCSYRHFEIDDLILNAAGVVAGFLAARGLRRPARPASGHSPRHKSR